MQISQTLIQRLKAMLGNDEVDHIVSMVKKVQTHAEKQKQKLDQILKKISEQYEDYLLGEGPEPDFRELEDFFLSVDESAEILALEEIEKSKLSRLAKRPTASEIRKKYDQIRKKKKIPKSVKDRAKAVKSKYLEKVKSVFESSSQKVAPGADKDVVRKAIQDAMKVSKSRANTILETETTRSYNESRRNYYDQSPDVTHYLYLAIRDHRTTEWCKDRHELVYTKGRAVTDRETPPVHWNCRSEMTPLTPQNPKHLKVIEDKSLRRENNSPKPLPSGWNR